MPNPKVFISYSHDSPEHADRVLTLSNRLRSDGIDCILDQYEPAPSEGWPRWMEKQIRQADFVLMICTETYYKRVMGEEKPGTGRGVRWEGNLIYNQIYQNDTKNSRFIPVLFQDCSENNIPEPLQGFTYYLIESNDGYEDLYRRLINQLPEKPQIGELKQLSVKQCCTNFFVGTQFPNKTNTKKVIQNNSILQSILVKTNKLIPIPETVLMVLRFINHYMLNDYHIEYNIMDLVNIINKDPVLVSKIFCLANSAYFHPLTPITDLKRAISRIGPEELRKLMLDQFGAGYIKELKKIGIARIYS